MSMHAQLPRSRSLPNIALFFILSQSMFSVDQFVVSSCKCISFVRLAFNQFLPSLAFSATQKIEPNQKSYANSSI